MTTTTTHNKKRTTTTSSSSSSSIKRIDLSRNGFGDPGALHLKELLAHNHGIQELCLNDTHISNALLATLKDGLRYNNSFLKNMFSTQVSLAILDSVQLMESISGGSGF
jgi:hypothetical protein